MKMNRILLGTALAAGLMATGTAQADTEDALLGGLLGVAVGTAITVDRDDRWGSHHHHYHEPRPARHHHPQGKAYGYWRKHDKHHHNRFCHHDGRRDHDRDGRRWDDRDWRWQDDDD